MIISVNVRKGRREKVFVHTASVAVFQDMSLRRFALVTSDQIKTRWIAPEVKATLHQASLARWRAVMEDI